MATQTKIFIDGEHGTTGLHIREQLEGNPHYNLLSLPHEHRHDKDLRADYLKAADVAILCLPDDASREAVSFLGDNATTRVIDSSTAFRTHPDWVYGFAEMTKGQRQRIHDAQFVANPGCFPTGAIGLLRPLRDADLLSSDYPITINAVSGYTGGGKQLIAQMEAQAGATPITANYFLYSLGLKHKHLPEMQKYGQLDHAPIFTPSVGRFPQGMLVNIPLYLNRLNKTANLDDIIALYQAHYTGQNIVEIVSKPEIETLERLDPEKLAGTDRMQIYCFGNDTQVNLVALLDNLGKGASGAALQNLDIMING